jgi:hypothetical protein
VSKKAAILALVIGFLMLMQPSPAFADQGLTTVICADPDGNQVTRSIGWDNSNEFFNGKGDIPRLYCEGGYAGIYTTYISDTLEPDSPLRYFNGIAPSPTPTPEPEPSATPEPSPEPTIEPVPSQEPLPTPTPEPTPTPTPEPTIEPSPTIESPVAPSPEPTPEPQTQTPVVAPLQTPTPTPTPSPEVTETAIPEPTLEPTPTPTLNPEVQTIELPENLQIVGVIQLAAAAEAVMNVGADMTEEEREESQIIAVAAIIVSQIAGSIRRMTK